MLYFAVSLFFGNLPIQLPESFVLGLHYVTSQGLNYRSLDKLVIPDSLELFLVH